MSGWEMSNISSYTGKFRVQKGSSNSSPQRLRQSLVCNPCRTSKLRCDRGHPCSNCVKRDDRDTCSYQRATEHDIGNSRNVPVEERLAHLESLIKKLVPTQEPMQDRDQTTSERLDTVSQDLAENVDRTQTGETNEMRYVGSTHWSAIMNDILELRIALGSSVDNPVEILPRVSKLGNEVLFGTPKNYSLQLIISQHLPSKLEIDRALSIYFRGETFIVPFVHTFHFQQQYREFLVDPANVNPLWLSILLSICYMASLVAGAAGSYRFSQNDAVTGRALLHEAAGQCLVLGEYYQPQPFTVEALVMYAHCQSLRSLDPSRECAQILGFTVRLAYEMGYHRDPDSFRSFSVFEGEMRRRFWATCKQMDLMVSFQFGIPSNIRFENSDTKSPRNLLDSDFDANTQVLPESRPESEGTRLLWFIVKDRLMPGFSKVCQDALTFKEKSEAEVLELDREIRSMRDTIPDVLRTRPFSESIADEPLLIVTRLYIEFIHLKSLCVLHRKYMTSGNEFSTRSCVEAGMGLVGQFVDMYKEFSPGGQLHGERWLLSNFTMNDFLLGVTVLCLVVHARIGKGSQNSWIEPGTEREVLVLLEHSLAICIEKSTTSKDAQRVSQAIRITLKGVESSMTQSLTMPEQALGPTALSLQPLPDFLPGDGPTFGSLDPFNFIGNDIGLSDFSIFDHQSWDQDTSYIDGFMSP